MMNLKDILEKCKSDLVCISCPWWRDIYSKTGREWIVEFGDLVDKYDVEYFCSDCSPADWQHYICIN